MSRIKQPPAEPIRRPRPRLSATLATKLDTCKRSGYLYLRHDGAPASHEMMRGTALHLFAEEMEHELVKSGDQSLLAAIRDEDPTAAMGEVASITAAMVNGIRDEHPDLTIPEYEWDKVREMAYHLGIGFDVDLADTVTGIEQKYVLDLDCGLRLVGKVDLSLMVGPDLGQADDYKTQFYIPEQKDFDRGMQLPVYGVLMCFGHRVFGASCPDCQGAGVLLDPEDGAPDRGNVVCHECNGAGEVDGPLEEPLGGHLQAVRLREVYPRFLSDDGTVRYRERIMSRTELATVRDALEAMGRDLLARLESWDFPAVNGPHCTYCPAMHDCPIPRSHRRFAGEIGSKAEAAEALSWADRQSALVKATRAEARRHVEAFGPVELDGNVWEIVVSEQTGLKKKGRNSDWQGLEVAARAAADYGEPFVVEDWLQRRPSSSLKRRSLEDGEVVPMGDMATGEGE